MTPGFGGYRVNTRYKPTCPTLRTVANQDIEYDTVVIHTVPELFPQFIERERALGKKILGYTVWEHDHLPSHWVPILNKLDGVLVPCRWNKDVFMRSGVNIPVYVVPHLPHAATASPNEVDKAWWLEKINSSGAKPSTVFYNIVHWNERKAPDLCLEAFLNAFEEKDNVVLVVKTNRINTTKTFRPWWACFRKRFEDPEVTVHKRLIRYYDEHGKAPPHVVVVTDESLSDERISALHAVGDIFFSTSRSEGWGMGAYDAALLAKPVVMPNYGGQREFLTDEHPLWIHSERTMVPGDSRQVEDRPPYVWASPCLSHASDLLRKLALNKGFKREQEVYSNQHAEYLRREFAEHKILQKFKVALGKN